MPTTHNADADHEWQREMDGLSADLDTLAALQGGLLSKTLVIGDFNMQPFELQGGIEPRQLRETGWRNFQRKWNLTLHNPKMTGDTHTMYLPLRQREVTIKQGSTRHGQGVGRAIDLILSTNDLDITMKVHNGLHCSGPDQECCGWPHCLEFANGDPFFHEVTIQTNVDGELQSASPKFPMAWRNSRLWQNALEPAESVLREFASLLDRDIQPKMVHRRLEQWVADASAWCLNTIGHVVRDGWLHPNLSQNNHHVHPSPEADGDLEQALVKAQAQPAGNSGNILARCFRLLRPKVLAPEQNMQVNDRRMSRDQTHTGWIRQLTGQADSVTIERHEAGVDVDACLKVVEARAMNMRGNGRDMDIFQPEVASLVHAWDTSNALPDLLPRALFTCGFESWDMVVWRILRLTGPSRLACRPYLWRLALMVALYKKGNPRLQGSYRLIMVKAQLGLLQESVLTGRIAAPLQSSLTPGQSGYIRGCEDPQLVLHEIVATCISENRSIWVVFGDFRKAYPNTWRNLLLTKVAANVQLPPGEMTLLISTFESDEVVVWLSGASSTVICDGVPEGGTLGTATYTTLPDDLVKELVQKQHGVGIGISIPAEWRGHVWLGTGAPQQELVQQLCKDLYTKQRLPSQDLLRHWPDLEASALRALDLLAPTRLVASFHADDPVILASSKGALQNSLDVLAEWAFRSRAHFHVGNAKTVVVPMGSAASLDHACLGPLTLKVYNDAGQQEYDLSYTSRHRWLGLLWDAQLNFHPALRQRLVQADAIFAELENLAATQALALPAAVRIFEGKVMGYLYYGMWLYALAEEAQDILDRYFDSWARRLLGADPWRNNAVARSELGWALGGFLRGVKAVALRRAQLWQQPDMDLYKSHFLRSHQQPSSWSARSQILLTSHDGIQDWPEWSGPHYEAYKSYVTHTLSTYGSISITAGVAEHQSSIPYLVFAQPCSTAMRDLSSAGFPWNTQKHVRSWCRLRAGLCSFGMFDNRRTRRKIQNCIFCRQSTRNPLKHVLGKCTYWQQSRSQFIKASGEWSDDIEVVAKRVLSTTPARPGFVECAAWAADLDHQANVIWSENDARGKKQNISKYSILVCMHGRR